VLADMIERNLHISLTLHGDWFIFTRPITLAMFVFVIFTAVLPFYRSWRRRDAVPVMVGDGE
jgi:TctA family transporter